MRDQLNCKLNQSTATSESVKPESEDWTGKKVKCSTEGPSITLFIVFYVLFNINNDRIQGFGSEQK